MSHHLSRKIAYRILRQPKMPSTKIDGRAVDRATGVLTESSNFKYLNQYKRTSIRQRYAFFGRDSGLKPGICWPTQEELDFMKQKQDKLEKPFDVMLKNLNDKREAEAEKKQAREKQIITNLKKLPKMKKEFWEKYVNLHESIESEKAQKAKVVEEIRESVGYDIDTKDPRFQEALAIKQGLPIVKKKI